MGEHVLAVIGVGVGAIAVAISFGLHAPNADWIRRVDGYPDRRSAS